ncbi:MAG: polyketide synthase dehydratase domain-containing protein [Smithellaceae bacterium]|nr:polyketide synthase dehydratase domain-containing protein [Smithellaceae bacterium]
MKNRFSFTIEIRPYLRDHYFEGKVIFPAVEALIVMAQAVRSHHPQANLQMLTEAHFPRMLTIDPASNRLEAQIEIESSESGISAALLTSIKINNGAMGRILEHARVTFSQDRVLPQPPLSYRDARKMASECINVPAASIYHELIPFGAAYQNISSDLSVSAQGALADIAGGSGEADDQLLGSPFVLDATMHAACVWGQRFTDIVPFPIGFDRRVIYRSTKKGGSYLARIAPIDVSREPFIFDAWIFDQKGIMCESISGLRMRDITKGRMRPPQWIREGTWK